MSDFQSGESGNWMSAAEDPAIDDAQRTREESRESPEPVPVRYSVHLESPDGGIKRRLYVDAGSLDEALTKARDEAQSFDDGPGRLRVVGVSEENASSEARRQREARRRHLNHIVETGLAVLGQPVPGRSDEEFFDVLCDFFSRAIVWPGRFSFPAGDAETDRLLNPNDVSSVMAQLLTVHLNHYGLHVTQAPPE
ncbi:hypothetical protein [Streptomyces sediminimaris]|uniref:hypothetical protein n=1 Tax=Streptomyces sediminimaris TaxID=3383721 RepID=UPI00399C2CDB